MRRRPWTRPARSKRHLVDPCNGAHSTTSSSAHRNPIASPVNRCSNPTCAPGALPRSSSVSSLRRSRSMPPPKYKTQKSLSLSSRPLETFTPPTPKASAWQALTLSRRKSKPVVATRSVQRHIFTALLPPEHDPASVFALAVAPTAGSANRPSAFDRA